VGTVHGLHRFPKNISNRCGQRGFVEGVIGIGTLGHVPIAFVDGDHFAGVAGNADPSHAQGKQEVGTWIVDQMDIGVKEGEVMRWGSKEVKIKTGKKDNAEAQS
jgi:hypothetical protein